MHLNKDENAHRFALSRELLERERERKKEREREIERERDSERERERKREREREHQIINKIKIDTYLFLK